MFIRRKQDQDDKTKKKKQKNMTPEQLKNQEKLERTIFNKLGSLETMFGSSAPKKTVKKNAKRARKA